MIEPNFFVLDKTKINIGPNWVAYAGFRKF